MNIYLYGINGVYNYGCEAMVRSISEKFSLMYPSSTIIYKTISYENDLKRLADCKTVKIERIEPKILKGIQKNIFYRVVRFALKKIKLLPKEEYLHIKSDWMKDCDVLVIIGGDIFDLTPKNKNKRYESDRIAVAEVVKKHKGKIILWGISVGDFEINQNAKKTLMRFFKKTVDYAIIRDEKSFNYLKCNGVNNIKLFADPAYMLREKQCEIHTSTKILGVNLSPLSNRYLEIQRTEEEWIKIWADIISETAKRLAFDKILLIPHVVLKKSSTDDDMAYLSKIKEALKEMNLNVSLIDDDLGFIGVKKHLVKCDMILAARMHCAINSITCGVPTVFLSYSPKSIGMSKLVYGNENMYFSMNDVVLNRENFYSKLSNISEHTTEIKEFLAKRNIELFNSANSAADYIKEVLNGDISEIDN